MEAWEGGTYRKRGKDRGGKNKGRIQRHHRQLFPSFSIVSPRGEAPVAPARTYIYSKVHKHAANLHSANKSSVFVRSFVVNHHPAARRSPHHRGRFVRSRCLAPTHPRRRPVPPLPLVPPPPPSASPRSTSAWFYFGPSPTPPLYI